MEQLERKIVLLRRREVEARTSLPRSRIYEKIAAGQFPRPVRLGPASVAWPEHEIDDWIASRIAARDAKARQTAPAPTNK